MSSFGFGGANAHVILEEAPLPGKRTGSTATQSNQPPPLTVSARNEAALRRLAADYAKFLETSPDLNLADFGFTLNAARTHMNHRRCIVADSATAAAAMFSTLADTETPSPIVATMAPAFLFTGQGSHYSGMGRQLYADNCEFRNTIDQCAEVANDLPTPITDFFADTSAELDSMSAPVALFALELGVARLLAYWGVHPGFVRGHSIGEFAAACIAGIVSMDDAMHLLLERQRLIATLPRNVTMAAFMCEAEDIIDDLSDYTDSVAIAAYNGPAQTVISGDWDILEQICAATSGRGIRHVQLPVPHAFHSPLMRPIHAEFAKFAAGIGLKPTAISFVSTVTATVYRRGETLPSDYWSRHLMEPVRFRQGVDLLVAADADLFLEIGPNPSLIGMARRSVPDDTINRHWVPTLRQNHDETECLATTLARLHECGGSLDWRVSHRLTGGQLIDVPGYPLAKSRFWYGDRQTPKAPPATPLLQRRLS